MRILHVTAQKPDSTGSGVYLNQVVRGCARMGCEQAVVCGVGPDDVPELPEGVSVYPVVFETDEVPFPVVGMSDVMPYRATRYRDMTPQMVGQFRAAFERRLRAAVADLKPDAIFCHHLYLLASWVRELFPDLPVAALSHSTCLRQLRQHGLERERIVAGIRGLDLVLALHEDQAGQIAEVFGLERGDIHVLGTGYDAGTFSRGASSIRAEKPKRLLFTGKISFAKGVASLVRALDRLSFASDELEVRLVGGAGDAEEHAVIARLAQASRYPVILTGRVSTEQLVEEYRRADTFVLPSFYEGLPLVVVEAMACGCKVVVTDLPGVRPWLAANLPDAPVRYVGLPRMEDVDRPVSDDLPAYEARLAEALAASLADPAPSCDPTALSWDALAGRLVSELDALIRR